MTRNFAPRADDEGKLGIMDRRWSEIHCKQVFAEELVLDSGQLPFYYFPTLIISGIGEILGGFDILSGTGEVS